MLKKQLALLSLFFLSFAPHVLPSKMQEEIDKKHLQANLNENELNEFLRKYPDYVNRSRSNTPGPATPYFENDRTLASYLLEKRQLGLAVSMAQRGDTFNQKLQFSKNPRTAGSTPLIFLSFIRPEICCNSITRLRLIELILENNPHAVYDERIDGMTPYLIAVVQGDLSLINLIEQACLKNGGFSSLRAVRDQKTKESKDNSAIDFFKYSIKKTKNPAIKRLLFLKFMDVAHFALSKEEMTLYEWHELQEKIHFSFSNLSPNIDPLGNNLSELNNHISQAFFRISTPRIETQAPPDLHQPPVREDDTENTESLQAPEPRSSILSQSYLLGDHKGRVNYSHLLAHLDRTNPYIPLHK
jgi:hypothetical protein